MIVCYYKVYWLCLDDLVSKLKYGLKIKNLVLNV